MIFSGITLIKSQKKNVINFKPLNKKTLWCSLWGLKVKGVMDELVECLAKFAVSDKSDESFTSFDNSLDDVINKFQNLNETCPDEEWDLLKTNFSKLRFINDTLENSEIINYPKFLESLKKFMEQIDKITQRYIEKIDWTDQDSEIQIDANIIFENFEKSLNINDPLEKLKIVLNAYTIFIPIVEKIRKERHRDFIDDQDFLNNFHVKRRKI